MAVFASADQLKTILGDFFTTLSQDPAIRSALLKANMVIRFVYREPDATITIVATQDPIHILCDDTTHKPEVEMSMKADIAHQFCRGNVNPPTALARRQIIAKGSIPKILRLLPVIKPAYALYPKFLEDKGIHLQG